MAIFKPIVLADGAATPVNHTFAQKANDNSLTSWEDRVAGVKIGYSVLMISTKDQPDVRKVLVTIAVPTLEAVSGPNESGFTPASRAAYMDRCKVEFTLPNRGAKVNRATIRKYAIGVLQDAEFIKVLEDGEEYF